MSMVHINTCNYCGASLYDYHKIIEKCPICKFSCDISQEEIISEYDSKAELFSSLKNDQALRHLVHSTITGVEFNDGELTVDVVGGITYHFETENDCCNSVWINCVEGIELALNHEVIDIKRNIVGVEESIDGDGEEEAISYTVVTTGGYLDIELRNNHNGYYGGRLSFVKKEEK